MNKQEEIRQFPKRVAVFISLLIALFAIGTFGFMLISRVSFQQGFMHTFESLAFMFKGTLAMEKALSIFLALFGVTLLWWILWSIFDALLEGNLREYLKIHKFLNRLEKMSDHYIIAGGGRVGEEIARALESKKKSYIIIEKDIPTLSRLKKQGFFAIHGDVTDELVLKKANITKAKSIILAMPETEKNLLVTMIAREMSPTIEIHARADKPAFVSKLKKAGAKTVVVPELAAAEKLLKELLD